MKFFKPTKKESGLTHWVTDNLGVGPAPMSFTRLDHLKERGVGAILNLCAEFPDLPEIQKAQGFDVYYLPILDEEAPDLEALDKALAWLDEVLYLGKKAYIHCRHGIGRTGTVLNAYLLRRGLGHKLAGRTLKKLRSKPESFDQWWLIRKYGKKAGKLTVRQPCLESKRQVDLAPFFRDYGELVSQTESVLQELSVGEHLCGREHTRCCFETISLTLIEALFVATGVDLSLSSQQRSKIMERASCCTRNTPRNAAIEDAAGDTPDKSATCPLLEDNACILFDSRPLACRTFDLATSERQELWAGTLNQELEDISRQLYFAYFSKFPTSILPTFTLPEVICGRYVQVFFQWIMKEKNLSST